MGLGRVLIWAYSALAVLGVLLIGGVHPATQVGLSAAALVLTALVAFRRGERSLRFVPLASVAVVALGVTALQLVPLPAAVVRVLSPVAFELRSDSLGHEPAWLPLTLDVPATLLALVQQLAATGFLLGLSILSRPLQRAHRALMPIAFLGGALALLTVAQRATGARSILGLYTPRSLASLPLGFYGTLVNGNHAASIFALSAILSFGLALELSGGRRFALLWSSGLSVLGVALTASRMGAVALAIGGSVFGVVLLARRFGPLRAALMVLVLNGLAAAAILYISPSLRGRLLDAQPAQLLWDNSKVRGFADGLRLVAHYPLTGVGRGAFEAPAEAYRLHDAGVRLVYPENLVLQTASEWGVPVLLLLVLLTALTVRSRWHQLQSLEEGTLAAVCGVLAVLVHDLADFGLELPGVALPTLVALCVVNGRLEERAASDEEPLSPLIPRWVTAVGLVAWAAVLAGGRWAASRTLDVDVQRADALAKAHDPELRQLVAEAVVRHPASGHFELLAAEDAMREADPAGTMRHLNRALRLHPADWQAHRLAARALAQLGRRSQSALEYRLAAEQGWNAPHAELLRVTAAESVSAVPQEGPPLLGLARYLAAVGRHPLAAEACRRAVERAPDESTRLACVKVAAMSRDPQAVRTVARPLLDSDPSPTSYVEAARALQTVGDAAAADRAIEQGMVAHPESGALLVEAGRLRFQRGDFTGARELVRRPSQRVLTLEERRQIEELLAQIADRTGEPEAAAAARARARLLSRRMSENRLEESN